jgi:hypothetical protein
MKEKHGEFISIVWDDYEPEFEYVRGHVTQDEAVKACIHYHGERDAPTVHGVKHRWARWVPASNWSDFSAMFYTYDEKSKGTFPVTEIRVKEMP